MNGKKGKMRKTDRNCTNTHAGFMPTILSRNLLFSKGQFGRAPSLI